MMINNYLTDNFFNFNIGFPNSGQVQSSLNPLLVFHQTFSLNPIGSKYSFSQVVAPTDIDTALASADAKSVSNDQSIDNKLTAQINTIDLTL
jgi:hypothetical protein